MTKLLLIIQMICYPLPCNTTSPYLGKILPEKFPFYMVSHFENKVTTSFNQHVIIYIQVSVKCRHRSIIAVPMLDTQWSISIDEIEGSAFDKSNEASINQSFELDWSSEKGLARISVIAPSIPFARPVLISLFQGGNLITRRLVNTQANGVYSETGFEIFTVDGIIDECILDWSNIIIYLANFIVIGFEEYRRKQNNGTM